MPNGKPGDHPVTDLLHYGRHPFPKDMEAMIRLIYSSNPDQLLALGLEPFEWAAGRQIEQGRERLKTILLQLGLVDAVPAPAPLSNLGWKLRWKLRSLFRKDR